MNHLKDLITATVLVAVCSFSSSFVHAQDRTDSQTAQQQLSQVKGKRRIFVDVANETTKRQIEDFFRKDNQFEAVQNRKDAELIYSAGIQVESKPSFGTLENRTALPKLASGERSSVTEQNSDAQFYKNQFQYRRKTSASVYYEQPGGNRVIVWSKVTLRITESKESGATLEYFRKSGDELSCAKQFAKAVKNLK
jgi:hypothetical protein